jgi:hypothetical protein
MRTSFFLALSMLAVGCGGLRLTMVDSAYQEPSNVAVFFTVDTADGEPVAGLEATDFKIYEDGQLVSVDESQQTIINPEVAAEHYTLLLVDMSGSVTESDQVGLIADAASSFTASLEGYQKVGIYAFDGSEEIHPVQPFRSNSAGIGRLRNFRTRDPSTNLHGALVQGVEVLDEAIAEGDSPLRFGTIVVFTDGTDRASRVSFGEMDDVLDKSGYDVFAIGVGNEIDEATLDDIGHSGYVLIADSAAIANAFAAISERIIGFTKRFYLLSYCSPARAGIHEVTIEAVVGEESGSLDYEFDATGFGPRCNPSQPPPFETSGRNVNIRGPARGRIEVRAEASAGGSAEVSATAE